MPKKPVLFTKHAVARILAFGFTEDEVLTAILSGVQSREGKVKFRATLRTKRGLLLAICAEHPDHIVVITVVRGGAK